MTTTMRAMSPDQTTSDEALAEIANLLSKSDRTLSLSDGQGGQVALPAEVVDAFRHVITAIETRKPMVLYPKLAQLTTQQAADYLGVSRPYLIQLLDEGKIPYTMTGTHRRILYGELMDFKRIWNRQRDAALEEIVRISEEAGLYDMDQTMDIDFRSR